MRGRVVAIACWVASAGCLMPLGADAAPLPAEGTPFVVLAWACGLQPFPWSHVLVTYPDASLYHLVVEARAGRESVRSDLEIPLEGARQVLADANATGAVDVRRYENYAGFAENGPRGTVISHAERAQLGGRAFHELRVLVAVADLPELRPNYTDSGIDDGCSYDLAGWAGGRHHHVVEIDDAGPGALDALRERYLSAHGWEPGKAPPSL